MKAKKKMAKKAPSLGTGAAERAKKKLMGRGRQIDDYVSRAVSGKKKETKKGMKKKSMKKR